jgi:hypothetical protein
VTTLEQIFDCNGWCDSFGGDNWADVTRYVQKYDKVDATTFVDIVVHAVHNGGCAFDKGLLIMVSSTSIVQLILDKKFNGNILELNYLALSKEVHAYVLEFKRLMDALDFPCQIPEELSIHKGITYDKIEWQEEPRIEINENEDRCEENGEYCYECENYVCTCHDECDCDCEECNPTYGTYPNLISPSMKGSDTNEKANKKSKKQEQEKAKNHGLDYDYNEASSYYPLSLR